MSIFSEIELDLSEDVRRLSEEELIEIVTSQRPYLERKQSAFGELTRRNSLCLSAVLADLLLSADHSDPFLPSLVSVSSQIRFLGLQRPLVARRLLRFAHESLEKRVAIPWTTQVAALRGFSILADIEDVVDLLPFLGKPGMRLPAIAFIKNFFWFEQNRAGENQEAVNVMTHVADVVTQDEMFAETLSGPPLSDRYAMAIEAVCAALALNTSNFIDVYNRLRRIPNPHIVAQLDERLGKMRQRWEENKR